MVLGLGLIHISASKDGNCQLWDLQFSEEEGGDYHVPYMTFSEDGSLLAVTLRESLEIWKVSTWERLWSTSYEAESIEDICFSSDGLRVFAETNHGNIHVYDVRSGESLGDEIGSMLNSMHDHVHLSWEVARERWVCDDCRKTLLENGEYWFTGSDRWLWIVEGHVARRLIQIPDDYNIHNLKGCQGCVAAGCNDKLLVLDTSCVYSKVASVNNSGVSEA